MYFEGEYIPVPERIGNWILQEKLGSGFSGAIYKAINPFNNQVAALKLQHVDHDCPTNQFEKNFYPALQGGVGMPTLWASGTQGVFDYLVIDLLGPSLDNLYRTCSPRVMDLRTVLSIAMQTITRLECMHNRGILHRDIQLGNCVTGLGPMAGTLYMIDFGFSKLYLDPYTRKHIPDSRKRRDFIGNYWFSSVNVHCRGRVPSRRDDMEALALMLIHLLTPNGLPWTRNGVPKYSAQEDQLVLEKKRARPEDLCDGLPDVFEDFLRYCRRLKFFDQPDYQQWRNEFADLALEHGFTDVHGRVSEEFIWPPVEQAAPPRSVAPVRAPAEDVNEILGQIANMNIDNMRDPIIRSIQAQRIDNGSEEFSDIEDDYSADSSDLGGEDELESDIDLVHSVRSNVPRQVAPPPPRPQVNNIAIAVSNERNNPNLPPIATLSDKSTSDGGPRTPVDQVPFHSCIHTAPRIAEPRTGTDMNNPATPAHNDRSVPIPQAQTLPRNESDVIVISSDEDSDPSSKRNLRVDSRAVKAAAIRRLATQASKATDDSTLSRIVQQFIQVLQTNGSKFMTKEGFNFLNALQAQLASPDVYIVHSDQRRATRSNSVLEPLDGLKKRGGQAEIVKFLRQRLQTSAQSITHAQAAEMVGAFANALKKSGGKTVTKDGFAFLVGIGAYLQVLY